MSNHGIRNEPPAGERVEPHQARAADPAPEAQNPIPLPNNHLLPLNIRLDRSNYTIWRSLVLAAVRAYDLDGYVLGHHPQPPEFLAGNILNLAFQNWMRFDHFLMHWLMNSVTEHMLGHVINCNTSHEIWTTFP
ncbi:uncharacterized protein LOC115713487 [Cannabis sativa]|uniref:uncharacterized protein LOC115713487 n=1 Tax=Cannabis sativa TaxID=3483 RepID=UPI0029CA2648|nr:uncharacterized protein LOC115713487 [Cannabis sativa]